ncbi:MAG: Trm112 family protein [Burkholderiales bacterium]|nr:Trm112 family protein [Burkholderiales bacterium]
MDVRLLELLVCPICKGPVQHDREARQLICPADRLAFPVRDGIPVMLENEAQPWAETPPAPPSLAADAHS